MTLVRTRRRRRRERRRHVRLTYPHLYVLDEGALRFTRPGGHAGDPRRPRRHDAARRRRHEPERVRELRSRSPRSPAARPPPRRHLRAAATRRSTRSRREPRARARRRSSRNRLLAGTSPRERRPTWWSSPTRRSCAAVEPLRALRQRQGLATPARRRDRRLRRVRFGQKTPYAIRAFLRLDAATSWRARAALRPPRRATPRSTRRTTSASATSTSCRRKLVPTAYMKTDSDDWFVDFDARRRSPTWRSGGCRCARRPRRAVVSKIVAATASRGHGRRGLGAQRAARLRRHRRVRLHGGERGRCARSCPRTSRSQRGVGRRASAPGARAAIVSASTAGQLLVNYPATARWTSGAQHGDIFDGGDAAASRNGARCPSSSR